MMTMKQLLTAKPDTWPPIDRDEIAVIREGIAKALPTDQEKTKAVMTLLADEVARLNGWEEHVAKIDQGVCVLCLMGAEILARSYPVAAMLITRLVGDIVRLHPEWS